MKIWAHRGCSQMYPENTLLAFEKAAALKRLTGIELDIQLTRDDHMVVIHDEKVDRTTDGIGHVRDYTLAELKKLAIDADGGRIERIPTIEEVLELIEGKMREGMKLNIELKNSIVCYEGMEEKIIDLIHKRGLAAHVIYSSFNIDSIVKVKEIDASTETGIIGGYVSELYVHLKRGVKTEALHPHWQRMDMTAQELQGIPVRAWFSGHLYPEKPTGTLLDLAALEVKGISDVFLNEPEQYV